MANLKIENVRITGVAACVPPNIVENSESELFTDKKELSQYIESTGVERRHVADNETCTSDLCFAAAEKLLSELKWDRSEIECLIFVTQTPDYIYPATAGILQQRLGLPTSCMAFDITMSCPGWVYGLSTISALISAGKIKKALLLVGETVSKTRSPYDNLNIITGDAGTATALVYEENAPSMVFDLNTDGKDYNAVLIPDGGFRNRTTEESLILKKGSDGVLRNRLHAHMDGAAIFSFAITMAPKSIKNLMAHYDIKDEDVDYYLLHQANLMITKIIQRKLKTNDSKFFNNITDFGNTSSSAIPLMIVSKARNNIQNKKIIACGFGGGLAWGSVYFELTDIVCPELIIYK